LEAYLPVLKANSDKVTGGIKSGVQQEAAHPGAVRTATEVQWKREKTCVSDLLVGPRVEF